MGFCLEEVIVTCKISIDDIQRVMSFVDNPSHGIDRAFGRFNIRIHDCGCVKIRCPGGNALPYNLAEWKRYFESALTLCHVDLGKVSRWAIKTIDFRSHNGGVWAARFTKVPIDEKMRVHLESVGEVIHPMTGESYFFYEYPGKGHFKDIEEWMADNSALFWMF